VAFFYVAVRLQECYGFEISGDSIVLTFVGIAATFVVVSNYIQVKEIKGEFANKITEIEGAFEKRINDKITDYDNNITGTMYILLGRIDFNRHSEDGYISSFFNYINALEYLDKASDQGSLDGVFFGIEELSESGITTMKTTASNKENAIRLLSKYPKGRELIDYVNSIKTFK
jgi:hypothetical protein